MNEMSRARKQAERLAPYVAEFGSVVFTAAAVFAVLSAAMEFLTPGFLANNISPAALIGTLVASGSLGLLPGGRPARPAAASRPYVAAAALVSIGSFLVAWYYFTSVPGVRLEMAAAAAVSAAAAFALAAGPRRNG